jgi:positive regulator of sigma E activity
LAVDKKIIVFCTQQSTYARLASGLAQTITHMQMQGAAARHPRNQLQHVRCSTCGNCDAQRTGSAALIKLSGDAGRYAACVMASAHDLCGL